MLRSGQTERATSEPTTGNDFKIQGFIGTQRQMLTCDSQQLLVLGKPVITI